MLSLTRNERKKGNKYLTRRRGGKQLLIKKGGKSTPYSARVNGKEINALMNYDNVKNKPPNELWGLSDKESFNGTILVIRVVR